MKQLPEARGASTMKSPAVGMSSGPVTPSGPTKPPPQPRTPPSTEPTGFERVHGEEK